MWNLKLLKCTALSLGLENVELPWMNNSFMICKNNTYADHLVDLYQQSKYMMISYLKLFS